MPASPPRFFQITAPKCGSQWVRDVLSAPEIVEHSGISLSAHKIGAEGPWPTPETSTLFAPVYWAPRDTWRQSRHPDDKAVVVLRDPRDALVSWVYSIRISHRENDNTLLLREVLTALSIPHCLRVGLLNWRGRAGYWRSWAERQRTDHEYVTDYRQLVEDPTEFHRIVAFFGWSVPGATIDKVLERLSFASRSGRERGEEDPTSHYRKGTSGDWRNHFDRETGRVFERRHPGLLVKMGYEQDPDWAEHLPETIDPRDRDFRERAEVQSLQAGLVRLRERQVEVDRNLEKALGSLSEYREQVQSLREKLSSLSQENKALKKAASGDSPRPGQRRRKPFWRRWWKRP